MKNLLKTPLLLLVIGFILGYITSVIADTINSNEVLYDNSNTLSTRDNVQDVLDDMYRIYNRSGLGFSLLTHNPVGLGSEFIGGLYRYQGATADNYICFGTTNKDTCTGDTDKYMYRIIGISSDGKMKLVKKEALNNTHAWNSLVSDLNGSFFLEDTNYITGDWANRIVVTDWHYFVGRYQDVNTLVETELAAPTSSSKIGLLYLHDICNANSPINCGKSWLSLVNNDSNAPESKEWLISKNDSKYVYATYSTGGFYSGSQAGTSYAVRPVFYLNSNQSIASGSGTITDPYILEA